MMNPQVLLYVLEAVRSAVPALRAGSSGPRPFDVLWPKRTRIHMGELEDHQLVEMFK